MSAAFTHTTKLRGWWTKFRPDSEACRQAILDQWHTLIARQQRGDTVGANISAAMLHDWGAF